MFRPQNGHTAPAAVQDRFQKDLHVLGPSGDVFHACRVVLPEPSPRRHGSAKGEHGLQFQKALSKDREPEVGGAYGIVIDVFVGYPDIVLPVKRAAGTKEVARGVVGVRDQLLDRSYTNQ